MSDLPSLKLWRTGQVAGESSIDIEDFELGLLVERKR
jgi:hypothetical protein